MDIQNGNHYGFVGLSGSGKSTIIDLFLGLLSPKEGEIKVDTKSLLEFGFKKMATEYRICTSEALNQ